MSVDTSWSADLSLHWLLLLPSLWSGETHFAGGGGVDWRVGEGSGKRAVKMHYRKVWGEEPTSIHSVLWLGTSLPALLASATTGFSSLGGLCCKPIPRCAAPRFVTLQAPPQMLQMNQQCHTSTPTPHGPGLPQSHRLGGLWTSIYRWGCHLFGATIVSNRQNRKAN